MKTISLLTLAATILASSVSFAKLEKASDGQAAALKKAFNIYKLSCSRLSVSKLKSIVENSQTVMFDESGAQPSIVFLRNLPIEPNQPIERYVISIKTDASYSQVLSLKYEEQEWQDVNLGTLLRPNFSKAYVTVNDEGC